MNEGIPCLVVPGEDPIGLTFTMLGLDWRIVGACSDAKYDTIKRAVQPTAGAGWDLRRDLLFRQPTDFGIRRANGFGRDQGRHSSSGGGAQV